MILLIHEKAKTAVEVWKDAEKIDFSEDLCKTFWQLAEDFPEELIVWVEKEIYPFLRTEILKEFFGHDLLMLSYAVKTKFLSEEIGYVDQLPFINVISGVKYPTWRMSSDVGGIKGKGLLKFRHLFGNILKFDYLLNSVAKVGQQNGLFCYSNPHLINIAHEKELRPSAGHKELFGFVYQHYNTIWVFVLFFSLVRYENIFPLEALFGSFSKPKFFKKEVDLSENKKESPDFTKDFPETIDVIIPTVGRPRYVKQIVEDLSRQSLLPKRIIIVEQQPNAIGSELEDLLAKEWPFHIVHIFTNQTGACMARNKALEKVESDWIFFADDDIRLEKEVLDKTLNEAGRLKVDCINLNCRQPGEETIFHKIKQWGSFGSGTSVVRSKFAKDLKFSEVFEHGYGEDADFGMKLRTSGCDIIYHPLLEIQHLKAPVGGFRKKPVLDWEKETPVPKPSPTLMLLARRYYTPRQMKGFKISLYLKYFRKQKNKNPFAYLRDMERNWKKSEEWAERLEAERAHSENEDRKDWG